MLHACTDAGITVRGCIFAAFVLVLIGAAAPTAADQSSYLAGLESLKDESFSGKSEGVSKIAESGVETAAAVLQALLDGNLFVQREPARIVIGSAGDDRLSLVDAATGNALGTAQPEDLKKIVINNQMRGSLRTFLARLHLTAPDPAVRREAVKSLLDSLTPETIALFEEGLSHEKDAGVQEALRVGLALAELEQEDPQKQLHAIQVLRGRVDTEARNRLIAFVERHSAAGGDNGDSVLIAARAALSAIDQKRQLYEIVETAFFGLSLGFVFVLAAIGLAITFGVMGVINMAHGELMMLGAYSTWVVQEAMTRHPQLAVIAAIPVAFVVSGLMGIAIERGVVRFLYGRPLETLLATFGISLVLQQTVRTVFSPLNRAVATPEWMSGQLVVNDVLAFTYNHLYIIGFSAAVFLVLVAILRFTTLGLQIRAVSQNRDMARALGVRSGWIDATTFGLGSGVAGLAGVALSQLTNVGPNLGQSYIVDSFMVVVFGGVGNLWGTLVAGLSLGIVNKFLEPFAGAVLAKIFVLAFIILFIQRRPRGLFPQQGRAAEA